MLPPIDHGLDSGAKPWDGARWYEVVVNGG